MRAFYFFLLLLLFFLVLPSISQAQSNLTLSNEDIRIDDPGTYEFLIPANIDTLIYPELNFNLQGADGGRSVIERSFFDEKIRGGGGANVIFSIPLGFSTGKLSPGGLLRFIVGEHGKQCFGDNGGCGAGGGGGTAILYLPPNVTPPTENTLPNTETISAPGQPGVLPTDWVLLAVGGGGGGASPPDRQGGSANPFNAGSRGGSGGSGQGGTGGADGEDTNQAFGGHGYLTSGRNAQPRDNSSGTYGGSGYGNGGGTDSNSSTGGGGGGGYSGGGAGTSNRNGGGGGSLVNGGINNPSLTRTNNTRFPEDGFISYNFTLDVAPGDPPVANCVDDFNVVIRGGESVTLTPADFDAGSFDPAGFDLTYQLCQWDAGPLEYVCRDSKTWDCGNVGKRQAWYLAVDNGYQTSYCHVDIRIVEELAAAECPYTGDVVVNLDDGCSQFFTPEELAPLNGVGCEDFFPLVEVTFPDNSSTIPSDFFTNGYTFGAGRNVVTYHSDGSNSCSYAVVVNPDPSPLPMTCPNNRTVDIRSDCTTELGADDLLLDYDGPGTITHSIDRETMASLVGGTGQLPDQTIERGLTIFTYTVVEPGGCEGSCSFEVNGRFSTDNHPTIVCQDATYPRGDVQMNVRQAGVAGLVSAQDDCGAAPVTLLSDIETGCDWVGVPQEVTLEAGIGFFSRSCTYNLTLTELDYTPTCSSRRLFVNLGEDYPQELPAEDVANWTAHPDLIITTTMPFIDCDDIQANHTVTITLEDDCGNVGSCDRIVVVTDRTDPIITCQDITRSLDANGEATISYSDLVTEVTDNCGQADMTFEVTQTEFTCSDLGDTEVFVTVRDRSENFTICRPIVTIVDEIAPELTCRTSSTVELGEDGTYRVQFSDFVINVSDNCGFGFNFSRNTLTCDDLGDDPVVVTINMRDASRNLTQCDVQFTIETSDCPCIGPDGILVVNNPENVVLCSDVTVNGVNFIEGNLNLAGYTLTIDREGRMLNEDESRFVSDLSGGKVVVLNANDNFQQTIDDLGLDILSGQEFQFSRTERSNLPVEIDGYQSIFRVITVEESYNDFINDNARLYYLDVELNGLVEDDLGLYVEQGGVWTSVPILGRNTDENWVEFQIDFPPGVNVVRYTLANAAALPLDLLSFTGEQRDKVNELFWTTANEEGFSHFEVERSSDGNAWLSLGAVAGAGQVEGAVEYGYVDNNPPATAYYRLRMVDLDGSFALSPVVYLEGEEQPELRVFPNPNSGSFTLQLPEATEPLHLALYTVHGTRPDSYRGAQKIAADTQNWTTQETLRPGVYLVVVSAEDGQRWTERVVVR